MARRQSTEVDKSKAISDAKKRRLAAQGITVVEGKAGGPPAFNFQGKKLSIGDERHPNFVGPKKPKGVGDKIGGMTIIGVKRQKRACGGRVKAKSGGRIKRAKVLSRGRKG